MLWHPNSCFGWVDLLTATLGLALLHGITPHAHLESRDGQKRWCSAAVDRLAVHNNPQSVDPIEKSRIEKKNKQVSSLISLFIEDHFVNLIQFFYFSNILILLSGLSLVTTDLDGDTYIH